MPLIIDFTVASKSPVLSAVIVPTIAYVRVVPLPIEAPVTLKGPIGLKLPVFPVLTDPVIFVIWNPDGVGIFKSKFLISEVPVFCTFTV